MAHGKGNLNFAQMGLASFLLLSFSLLNLELLNAQTTISLNSPISAEDHDAYELLTKDKNSQNPVLTGSTIPLGTDPITGENIRSAFYFPGFIGGNLLPKNASIISAYIDFGAEQASTGPCQVIIQAEASQAKKVIEYSNDRRDVSSRRLGKAAVNWNILDWPARNEFSIDQRTPDISSVIQEIVDNPKYMAGDPISIMITGTGQGIRYTSAFSSFWGGARLHITYSVPSLAAARIAMPTDVKELEVSLFPNPFQQSFTLEIPNSETDQMELLIYNLQGQIIYHQTDLPFRAKIKLPEHIGPGMYIARIIIADRQKELKVIKY